MAVSPETALPARGARVHVSDWRWMLTTASDASTPPAHQLDASPLLSFDVDPGECVLIRGASGSGKSTLLACLAGLIDVHQPELARAHLDRDESADHRIVEGHIRVETLEVSEGSTGGTLVRPARVGLLLQDPMTQAVMPRVGDDVAFGLENVGVRPNEMPARIRNALDAVGLDVGLDTLTDKLSGGQRQRLALAGLLAMRPSLLLLDEPTAHLDPEGATEIRDAVARIVREHHLTLIVVDHTPDFWADIVTRTIDLAGPEGRHVERAKPAADVALPRATSPRASQSDASQSDASHTGASQVRAQHLARATDLAVGYPRAPRAHDKLNFVVDAGRILTVTGPNGSGKSALALTLARLIPARAGSLDVAVPRSRVGLVFQTPDHQFTGSTVFTDVLSGVRHPRRERDRRVWSALTEFHLAEFAHRNPFSLSGGEKRRLSIADVVAAMSPEQPGLLIFDEPSAGQDDRTWHDLVVTLHRLADAGHGLVVITHDRRLISAVSDCRLELHS